MQNRSQRKMVSWNLLNELNLKFFIHFRIDHNRRSRAAAQVQAQQHQGSVRGNRVSKFSEKAQRPFSLSTSCNYHISSDVLTLESMPLKNGQFTRVILVREKAWINQSSFNSLLIIHVGEFNHRLNDSWHVLVYIARNISENQKLHKGASTPLNNLLIGY